MHSCDVQDVGMRESLIEAWDLVLLQSILSFDRVDDVLRHAESLRGDVVDGDVVEEGEELYKRVNCSSVFEVTEECDGQPIELSEFLFGTRCKFSSRGR